MNSIDNLLNVTIYFILLFSVGKLMCGPSMIEPPETQQVQGNPDGVHHFSLSHVFLLSIIGNPS